MPMDFTIPVASLTYIYTLIAAEMTFLVGRPRRDKFLLRLLFYFIVYPGIVFCIGMLSSLVSLSLDNELYNFLYTIVHFIIIFMLSVPFILLCYSLKAREVLFICAAGYSVEHISNGVVQIVSYIMSRAGVTLDMLAGTFFNLFFKFAVIALLYFTFIRHSVRRERMMLYDGRVFVVAIVNLIICLFFNVFKTYGAGQPTNAFTTDIICSLYAVTGCLLCLLLQTGFFRESNLKNDNVTLERLLLLEEKKQTLTQETIDLINIKCHDLKYQLRKLEDGTSAANADTIREIYDAFSMYDRVVKTGNDVFDMLLMERIPVCEKRSVKFSYMIDGAALSFMRACDVSSLFGNIMDNAMESVFAEEDAEKRVISLSVEKKNSMVIIHQQNYCRVAPSFESGLPLTTKEDKNYHGFGVRGIRLIVSRYGGQLRMRWENSFFMVDILIPVKEEKRLAEKNN